MTSLEVIFWLCVAGVVYAYAGYPLLLRSVSSPSGPDRASAVGDDPGALPRLTALVAARNEAARIQGKLDDLLAQEYPADKLHVLVVSDGSTDATAAIARSVPGVECIELERRMGKENAQVRGISAARGEVIVFTDVATRIGGEGLKGMARALSAPGVGAVSSEDRFLAADGKPAGEGLYVRYEMWLRRLESQRAGLVGLSGSLFGVRRELCDEWPSDVPSDFVVALRCARRGLKAVSLPKVHGLYPDLKQDSAEFARKRRTAVRGMAGLASAPEVLNPAKFGLFSFQVWSHKLMRWGVPWFMLGALLANIALLGNGSLYDFTLLVQLAGYGIAALAALMPALRRASPVRILYFFVLSNLALAFAGADFVRGRRVVQWEPSVR